MATDQWSVTCECGFRTRGMLDEVVTAIQEHGQSAHQRDLTRDEVLAIAEPI